MACFLCEKVVGELKNTIVNLKDNTLGKVCSDCIEDWKEFCEHCKVLKRWPDIKYDMDGKVTCLKCVGGRMKVCYGCEFRAIFVCTCDEVYCKICAEKHFVQKFNEEFSRDSSMSSFKHKFTVYGTSRYLPNFQQDYLKELIKEYNKNIEELRDKNIILRPLKRLADIYKFSIEVFEALLEKLGTLNCVINLISANFDSGNYFKAKDIILQHLDSFLADGSKIDKFCQYLVYFTPDLTTDQIKSVFKAISTHKSKFSSKYESKLYKAWFKSKKTNKKKVFGKFIQSNWTQPASLATLQLLTMTCMFTRHPSKQNECINYLLFYFQSFPELSFIYHSKAQTDPDPSSKSTSLFYSFQVILRFSDFSNDFLINRMTEYIETLVQVDQNKAGLYYVKLLEECLINRHKAFDALKENASTYITNPSLLSKIQQL